MMKSETVESFGDVRRKSFSDTFRNFFRYFPRYLQTFLFFGPFSNTDVIFANSRQIKMIETSIMLVKIQHIKLEKNERIL